MAARGQFDLLKNMAARGQFDLMKNMAAKEQFDLMKNMAARGQSQFFLYIHRENIKNLRHYAAFYFYLKL